MNSKENMNRKVFISVLTFHYYDITMNISVVFYVLLLLVIDNYLEKYHF